MDGRRSRRLSPRFERGFLPPPGRSSSSTSSTELTWTWPSSFTVPADSASNDIRIRAPQRMGVGRSCEPFAIREPWADSCVGLGVLERGPPKPQLEDDKSGRHSQAGRNRGRDATDDDSERDVAGLSSRKTGQAPPVDGPKAVAPDPLDVRQHPPLVMSSASGSSSSLSSQVTTRAWASAWPSLAYTLGLRHAFDADHIQRSTTPPAS